MLFVTSPSSIYRYELKALGGRWNPKFHAWLLPLSQRSEVEKLAETANIDIDLYDTAAGHVILLPRTANVAGITFTYYPSHHALPSHLRRIRAPRETH